jgi:hypothetical protein
MLLNNSNRIHIGVIQVFVLKTYFFTVRFVENNLFVVISQFEVNISTCNDQLESFIKDFSKLFNFQKYAELLAHAANAKLETVCNDRDSKTLKKTAFDLRSSPILPYSMTTSTTANWFSSS